jgi:chemotaxis regulatin CheY-phosphate phosphatase CheZ
MQILKRVFNPTALRQWAIVFLAGLVVLVTTACGAAQSSTPARDSVGSAGPAQNEAMYPHKDTDRDTSAADAKADRMIRQAEQRIESTDDNAVKEAAKNIGKATKRAANNAVENTKEAASSAANAVDRNTPNS